MNATLTRWTAAGTSALALAAAGAGVAAAATTPAKATVFTAQLKETGTVKPSAALLTALRGGKATIWLKATKPTSALSGQAKAQRPTRASPPLRSP